MLNFAENIDMSKRNAKKRIGAAVASMIDRVLFMDITDEQLESKINALFNTYEAAVKKINGSSKVKGKSAVKKHFTALFADVKKQLEDVVSAK
ncbi:MAG TPA: hypothetical protein PKC38_09350 [Chitinophagales bacterium]|nr:hypothetical protein [Chitinophagales bacterium]HMX03845.1 hypothetical protein [Chitinophagales bacterium]